MSMFIPNWSSKLPTILGRPRLAIDNNVLSDFYLRKSTNPELPYIFETSNIVSCCSRQVINEALNAPSFAVTSRQLMWNKLGDLQNEGRLFLSGLTQMDVATRDVYSQLATLLGSSNLSPGKDANVFADSIVKSLPLYTTERRSIDGMDRALRNAKVSDFLEEHNLPTEIEKIVANV